MITIDIEDAEGLLKAIEDFFGPEIFRINTSADSKVANLHKYGCAIKEVLDERRAQEDAAKQIVAAFEKFKEKGDEDNFQEFLDETVHDLASNEGSNTNNDGFEDQVLFILREMYDEEEVRRQIASIFEENERLYEAIIDPHGQES